MKLTEGTIIPTEDGDFRVKHDVEIMAASIIPSSAFERVDGTDIQPHSIVPEGLISWLVVERDRQS